MTSVNAIPLRESGRHEAGCCDGCGRALRGLFSVVRGRDSRMDEDAFFADRFCSSGCYHAYGRRVGSPAASARWN